MKWIFWKYKFYKVWIFFIFYTQFGSLSQNKPGRQDVPFVAQMCMLTYCKMSKVLYHPWLHSMYHYAKAIIMSNWPKVIYIHIFLMCKKIPFLKFQPNLLVLKLVQAEVALRPRRPGSVFTHELAICSKCGGEKKISGVNYSFICY